MHGIRVIAIGIVLAIAGIVWAWMPVHGLCPMSFRSVDTYHIRLVTPAVSNQSAWDRTFDWAVDECSIRVQVVIGALILYNIGALAYLRRKRVKKDLANEVSQVIIAPAPKPEN